MKNTGLEKSVELEVRVGTIVLLHFLETMDTMVILNQIQQMTGEVDHIIVEVIVGVHEWGQVDVSKHIIQEIRQ